MTDLWLQRKLKNKLPDKQSVWPTKIHINTWCALGSLSLIEMKIFVFSQHESKNSLKIWCANRTLRYCITYFEKLHINGQSLHKYIDTFFLQYIFGMLNTPTTYCVKSYSKNKKHKHGFDGVNFSIFLKSSKFTQRKNACDKSKFKLAWATCLIAFVLNSYIGFHFAFAVDISKIALQ